MYSKWLFVIDFFGVALWCRLQPQSRTAKNFGNRLKLIVNLYYTLKVTLVMPLIYTNWMIISCHFSRWAQCSGLLYCPPTLVPFAVNTNAPIISDQLGQCNSKWKAAKKIWIKLPFKIVCLLRICPIGVQKIFFPLTNVQRALIYSIIMP